MMSTAYSKLKVADLKIALRNRNRDPPLVLTGNKAALIARLVKDDQTEGERGSPALETTILTQEQVAFAGPSNEVHKWAVKILDEGQAYDETEQSQSIKMFDHPDILVIQNFLIEVSTAIKEMNKPDPPSMVAAFETLKRLVCLEMVDTTVFHKSTQSILEAFDIDCAYEDLHLEPNVEHDFESNFTLPVKQALGGWLATTVRNFDFEGIASKFPEHFQTEDVSTIRAWAKKFIRDNKLDTTTQISAEIFEQALADQALTVVRAKTLTIITTVLNQAAAAINRDKRVALKKSAAATPVAAAPVGATGVVNVGGSAAADDTSGRKRRAASSEAESSAQTAATPGARVSLDRGAKKRRLMAETEGDDSENDVDME